MRVLVVDDAPAVRTRLVALREEVPGIETSEASELDAAFQRVKDVDIVVLDIHLPGRSGLSAVPLFGALRPRPLIIVLTNDATEHHRREALLLGADHFLDKSREFDRVIELVSAARS
ncbi:MAG: response regulator [Polyangiales bacterium]